ncbi:MAG: ATP synthase F1 subunit epsilon [Candidatus Magasanikbacteria bacterium CG_4_10_14_0_8_um_filter_32_14]|uniref:ATP synthase epsilon chain n=1 Tax=Candidatus Magasanikbacteria bacterium CG_4_10_14_0_8_um_filter_32_14 TaxID=1974640 RepID=A0A2M7RA97_9BACT|nr:MAG: ATP synthase F1 subunit epsilon [Candidatus Magasanikbacteria bacterium CG_4_10_14_0_8_um_filter_32_14]
MINFKIVTPERLVYENEIYQVSIPTTSGEITVLPSHIPMVSVLAVGELKIIDKDGEHPYAVAGGFLEIQDENKIVILADKVERADTIDVERAQEARKRAEEEMIKAKAGEDVDFARLQALIDKEMNRIRVGNKYRKLK